MTDSEILARWQGYKQHPNGVSCYTGELRSIGGTLKWPDYLNDDSAAMSLLDTLVEKGFATRVEYDYEQDQWAAVIFKPVAMGADSVLHIRKSSRREAIIAACLEVARKE